MFKKNKKVIDNIENQPIAINYYVRLIDKDVLSERKLIAVTNTHTEVYKLDHEPSRNELFMVELTQITPTGIKSIGTGLVKVISQSLDTPNLWFGVLV